MHFSVVVASTTDTTAVASCTVAVDSAIAIGSTGSDSTTSVTIVAGSIVVDLGLLDSAAGIVVELVVLDSAARVSLKLEHYSERQELSLC